MKEVTTKTGYKAVLQDDPADNWEILRLLRDYANGNPYALVDIAERLLGLDGLHELEQHVKEQTGRVSTSAMEAEIHSIFANEAKLKN